MRPTYPYKPSTPNPTSQGSARGIGLLRSFKCSRFQDKGLAFGNLKIRVWARFRVNGLSMDSSGCMYMTKPLSTVDGCCGVTAGLATQSKTLHLSHFTLPADGVQGSGLSLWFRGLYSCIQRHRHTTLSFHQQQGRNPQIDDPKEESPQL